MTAPPVILDEAQRSVVEHRGGPLLVLAGPGTGKTTTMVEAIAELVADRGVDPSEILALTFSRKAAEHLRDRVTQRLARTLATPLSMTFHSYAYALLNAYRPAELYSGPLRLLSAAEQDVVIHEMVTGPDALAWPEDLADAVPTRGFAAEVTALLARARERGMDGVDLHRVGAQSGNPAWAVAGAFLERYLDVLDNKGAVDYADLIRRAGFVAAEHAPELRARHRWVFVDEYQDTDPSQVDLLEHIAGEGGNLVVVGDPHQSIYAFRGADVRGISRFTDRFRTRPGGEPAPVIVLGTTRRFGSAVLEAATRVADRLPLPVGIDERARAAFATPRTAKEEAGSVEVLTFDTERAEAEHIADRLRRAHLHDGVAWHEMAVLLRSGRHGIPRLRRALAAADVPVEVAADETALVEEPAVRHLLAALDAADCLARGAEVTVDAARDLLVSPLSGIDAADLRALARDLRAAEHRRYADEVARGVEEPVLPRSSAELTRDALVDPDAGTDLTRPIARLLATAAAQIDDAGSVAEVLWTVWSGTTWPERLESASAQRGASARAAHRHLDAICALFELADRAETRAALTGVREFTDELRAQRIPADTLAERGVRGGAVRLMTAHRAKGLEWELVVLAHVQEESWPDLRRRTSLLATDRLGEDVGEGPMVRASAARTAREALADERRLFFVGVTRARSRLLVTAVKSPDEDGEQPSRFLTELLAPDEDGTRPELPHIKRRPDRPLSAFGLVSRLRRTVADPAQPEPLRRAAALRLARLTEAHRARELRAPGADPEHWWGARLPTRAPDPIVASEAAVRVSATMLTALQNCPRQWFLEREAGGAQATTQAQGFGNLVHALAEHIAQAALAESAHTPSRDELLGEVDRVWAQIPFRTPWASVSERVEVEKALDRLIDHHGRTGANEVKAAEQSIEVDVDLPDGTTVSLHGYADRIELDADGRVVVIDLKTGKYPPTGAEVEKHPQLGLYHLAVEHGALKGLVGDAESGGGELWQLRHELKSGMKVQRQPPQERDESGTTLIERQLVDAVTAMRAEEFPARPDTYCKRCEFARLCPAQHASPVI